MRNMTTRSWALLATVSGFLLGSSVGCIVIAAFATVEPVEDAPILSTRQISMQMDQAGPPLAVMTERLRCGAITDRVREERVALVSLSEDGALFVRQGQ